MATTVVCAKVRAHVQEAAAIGEGGRREAIANSVVDHFAKLEVNATDTGVCKINARSESVRYDSQTPFSQITMLPK